MKPNKFIVHYVDKDGDYCSVWVFATDIDNAEKQLFEDYWDVDHIVYTEKAE